jgi:hypothetical protein
VTKSALKEGSPAEERQDYRQAKKAGMTPKAFEKSGADKKSDKKGFVPFGKGKRGK